MQHEACQLMQQPHQALPGGTQRRPARRRRSGAAGEVLGGLPLVRGEVLRGRNVQEPLEAARPGPHQLRGQRAGQRLHLQHALHDLRLPLPKRHHADLLRAARIIGARPDSASRHLFALAGCRTHRLVYSLPARLSHAGKSPSLQRLPESGCNRRQPISSAATAGASTTSGGQLYSHDCSKHTVLLEQQHMHMQPLAVGYEVVKP